MRELGRSPEGGYIVEMTNKEYKYFARLTNVVEGKTPWDIENMHEPVMYESVDLGNTFSAIRSWTLAKMRLNELQSVLDRFSEALGRVDDD